MPPLSSRRPSTGASSRSLLPLNLEAIASREAAKYWYRRLALAQGDLVRAERSLGTVQLRGVAEGSPGRSAWAIGDRTLVTCSPASEPIQSVHLGDGSYREVKETLRRDGTPELVFLRVADPLPDAVPLATHYQEGDQIAVLGLATDPWLAPGRIVGIASPDRIEHDCASPQDALGAVLLSLNSGRAVGIDIGSGRAIGAARIRDAMKELGLKPAEPPEAIPGPLEESDLERRLLPADYDDRGGYDESFIGVPIPPPKPRASGPLDGDLLEYLNTSGERTKALPYTHFSVFMSKSRRIAMFTCVNLYGAQLVDLQRAGGDRWSLDPRVPEEAQIGESLYSNNDLDRGHLVRRLDPVWGENAELANWDTFHFTNCSPQHKDLNQEIWNDLEEYIYRNAGRHDLKVNVFTGPVFGDDDPIYRDVRIPTQYWKVVTMVRDDGELSATAYILSQADMIEGLEFAYGGFRTYQLPITELESLTSLSFGDLSKHDPKEDDLESAAERYTRIEKPEDLTL